MTPASAPPAPRPPLVRPRRCVLAGVCAALARHLRMPVGVVRVVIVVAALAGGAGVLFYLWLWALVPLEPDADGLVRRRVRMPWLLFAIGVAAALATLASGAHGGMLPLTVVAVAAACGAVAWDQLVEGGIELAGSGPAGSAGSRPSGSGLAGSLAQALAGAVPAAGAADGPGVAAESPGLRTAGRSSRRIRTASGVLLVALAVLEPVSWSRSGTWLAWPLFTITVLAAAVVLFGPWALRLWRELLGQRTSRVREEQRAEMAAHLHDSVLQTLALIQNRAGAGSEVARIARAQERELRDWLYAGSAPLDTDLVTELRDFAAALELDHEVRIDVVGVGQARERGDGEVAAAAREAMLNAARHAGGEVSVYVENAPDAVDVYVRDRGPGFDPAAVPQGRLGVRESILGRMRRAGGSARVGPGAGGVGTEVHLHFGFPDRGQADAGAGAAG